jgi:hypothetical protein
MSIKTLPLKVEKSLDLLISKKYKLLVWDAFWVDELIQGYFVNKNYYYLFVYSISYPRIFKSEKFKNIKVKIDENIKDLRERQTWKDRFMSEQSDVSFVIWNWASKWSYNNIIRTLKNNNKIQVFYKYDFLKEEELNIDYISNIYNKNHKYSLSEYIKEENSKIKNVKKMKEILINEWILIWENKINEEYKNIIDIKLNRWKEIFKYPKSLLDKFFYSNNTFEQPTMFI